jgi:hypothetical protein
MLIELSHGSHKGSVDFFFFHEILKKEACESFPPQPRMVLT